MSLPYSPTRPAEKPSTGALVLFSLSVLSVLGAVGLGLASVPMYRHEVEFGGFGWTLLALLLGALTLFCVTIPSCWFHYRRKRHPKDGLSLRLSVVALVILSLEFLSLVMFGH